MNKIPHRFRAEHRWLSPIPLLSSVLRPESVGLSLLLLFLCVGARGQQLFTGLACAGCHQLGKEGIAFGPNLNDVVKKYQGNAQTVLAEILDPSGRMSCTARSNSSGGISGKSAAASLEGR